MCLDKRVHYVSPEEQDINVNSLNQEGQWQSKINDVSPRVGGWPDVATFINKVEWTGEGLILNFRCRPNKPVKRWIGDASVWSTDGIILSFWDLDIRDSAGTLYLEDQLKVYTGEYKKVRLEIIDQYVYAVDGDRASLSDANLTFTR